MPSQTNEQALEAAIQETLSGTTIEIIKEQNPLANIAEESYPSHQPHINQPNYTYFI